MSVRVRALFDSLSALEDGCDAAAAAGGRLERRRTPVPPHDDAPSPVRRWVLFGGIAGFVSGWALTVGTALAWPLRVGGKPIVSWPAFFVIAFELTILFAALAGLAGFARAAGLPRRPRSADQRVGVDRFEAVVAAADDRAEAVRDQLKRHGAALSDEAAS